MADISIALNNVQNVKTVNIEGLGVLTVRKLGAGEDLDLSSKMRRLGKVIDELSAIDFSKLDARKPEHLKIIEKESKRAEALSDELAEIKRFEFNMYKRCLSDDQGGKVVDVVMNTLTEQERAALFMEIFGENRKLDVPDVVKPETEDEKSNE